MNSFDFPTKIFLSAAVSITSTVAILAAQSACAAVRTVMAADAAPSPKTAAPDEASTSYAGQSMVIHNPDGTFTVQKKGLPSGSSKDTALKEGLVIPPQVVVPIVPSPERKQ